MALSKVYPTSPGPGPTGPPDRLPPGPGITPGGFRYSGAGGPTFGRGLFTPGQPPNMDAINQLRAARGLPPMGSAGIPAGTTMGAGFTPVQHGHMLPYGTVAQTGAAGTAGSTGGTNTDWLRYLTGGYDPLSGNSAGLEQTQPPAAQNTMAYLQGYYNQIGGSYGGPRRIY